jgi:integrase
MRLDALDGDGELILDVLKWQARRGYAVDSLRLLRNHIKQLLDRALSHGYILQHPLRDPEVLKDIRGLFKTIREAHPEKVKAMTSEEARRFLAVAEEHSPLFQLFATGFGTGARLSELLALQPDDDVVRPVEGTRVRQLHVWKALPQRMSRKNPQPKRLKNGADYHVDIPARLAAILDVHKQTLSGGGWLFQTKNGTPYSHEHVQGEFKRIVKLAWPTAGEKWELSPHSMRHTFATLHILSGKPAKWVSKQLGHADVTVTLKVYASAFEMACPGAADEHGERLFGRDGTTMVLPRPAAPGEPAPVLH